MQGDNRYLVLMDEQKVELTKWAQSRSMPAGDVFRARLILALGAGQTYVEIAGSLQTQPATISFWKQRFSQMASTACRAGIAEARHAR